MKNILLLLCLLATFGAIAQKKTTAQYNKVIATDSFKLGKVSVSKIVSDTTFSTATNTQLPTALAVRRFVNNKISGSNAPTLLFPTTTTIRQTKVGNTVSSEVRDSSISLQKLTPAIDNTMILYYVNDTWTHQYLADLPTPNYANTNLSFISDRTHNLNGNGVTHLQCGKIEYFGKDFIPNWLHTYFDETILGTSFGTAEIGIKLSSVTNNKELFLKTTDISAVQNSGSLKKAFMMQKFVDPNWNGESEFQNAGLDNLQDVNIANVQDNDVLAYIQGTGWRNTPLPPQQPGGLQSVSVLSPLSGNGTTASPIAIVGHNGLPNGYPFVLLNNGPNNPVSLSTIRVNAELAGIGSTAIPLALNQQGATNGQALRWNGTRYAPTSDAPISTSYPFIGTGTTASPLSFSTLGATSGQIWTANGTTAGWADAPTNLNKVIAKYSRVGTQPFSSGAGVVYCKYNTILIAPIPLTAIVLDPLTGDLLINKSGKYRVDVIEYVPSATAYPNITRGLSIVQNTLTRAITSTNYTPSFSVGTVVNITAGDIIRIEMGYSTLNASMGDSSGNYSQITITEL